MSYKSAGGFQQRERGITLSNGKTKIVQIQGGDDDGDDNGDDEAVSLFSSPAMPTAPARSVCFILSKSEQLRERVGRARSSVLL